MAVDGEQQQTKVVIKLSLLLTRGLVSFFARNFKHMTIPTLVFIDSNLTWQQHVDYIYNKIVKFVGIFL